MCNETQVWYMRKLVTLLLYIKIKDVIKILMLSRSAYIKFAYISYKIAILISVRASHHFMNVCAEKNHFIPVSTKTEIEKKFKIKVVPIY